MIGTRGESFATVDDYLAHLKSHLPEPYLASRDMSVYVSTLREVAAGTLAPEQASRRMPSLKRVGGVCPCSKSVRWIVDEPEPLPANGKGSGAASRP
jgi:hypothetical protein